MTTLRRMSMMGIVAAAIIAISAMTPMEAFATTFNGPQAFQSISTPIASGGVTFGPGNVACTYTVTVTQDSSIANKFYVQWNNVPQQCIFNGHSYNLLTMRTLVSGYGTWDISPPSTQTTMTLTGFTNGNNIGVTVETYYG